MKIRKTGALLTTLCTLMCLSSQLASQESSATIVSITDYDIGHIPEDSMKTLGLVHAKYLRDPEDYAYLNKISTTAKAYLYAFKGNGEEIQLMDASTWAVNPRYARLVTGWQNSELLFIKPRALKCFDDSSSNRYPYVIYNFDRNEIIEVKMTGQPTFDGATTFFIERIEADTFNKYVYVNNAQNNRTVWKIDPTNTSFNKWKADDRIIVGMNNFWRTTNYNHILINVTMNNAPYAPAKIVN